ncbi:MAG: redoxin domain-containing protein [Propionibacteriales bacterium]|nr:redoxin domain-containing protein [Propionibacteriales bacterium]
MPIEVGARAPEFTLKDQHGQEVSLADFRGGKNVLLVFYPASFTGVCTHELAELQAALPTLRTDRSELLAVSCDSMFTQRVFADQEGLEFPVLSDFWPHGAVASAYGVLDEAMGVARRGTFVIDREGVVRWQVVNQIREPRTLSDYQDVLSDIEA